MAKHKDGEPVTWGDFRKVVKRLLALEALVDDAFTAIAEGDANQAEFWNEHEEKLERLNRSLRRLKKQVEEISTE